MTAAKAALPFAIALVACAPRDPRCQVNVYDGGHIGQCMVAAPAIWYAYFEEYDQCGQPVGCTCDQVCQGWQTEMFETLEECERVCVEPWP